MSAHDPRRTNPAALRNREPIADVLARVLPREGRVLEIASGSGEHVVCFAARFPALRFQPSDPQTDRRASIDAYVADLAPEVAARIAPALDLDVLAWPWPIAAGDPIAAIICINMIHASVPETVDALMRGAGALLAPGAPLVTYGPYRIDGAHTAPSNAAFDLTLKGMDPRWGVRDLEAVVAAADAHGLTLVERVAMPANNFVLWFARRGPFDAI